MRVAVDATPLVGPHTGIAEMTLGLIEALDAQADVSVVSYVSSWRHLFAKLRRSRTQPSAHEPVVAHSAALTLPASVAPWIWRSGWPSIERALGEVDVVHGTNYTVPPARRALRVVSVGDLSFLGPNVPPTVKAFDRHVAHALSHGAVAHCLSEGVAASVRDRYRTTRVGVVPPVFRPLFGTPPHRATAETSDAHDRPAGYALVLGSTAKRKRVPDVVRAFGAVAQASGAPSELVIAGPADAAERDVRAAIDAQPARVRARVRRLGWVNESRKQQLIDEASVLVFASEQEGFGYPALEALGAGLPVVATPTLGELVGDAARLVAVGDVDAIGAAMVELSSDPRARSQLIEAGLRRAAQFTPQDCVAAMLELYRRYI